MELKILPNFSIPNVSTRFLISPFYIEKIAIVSFCRKDPRVIFTSIGLIFPMIYPPNMYIFGTIIIKKNIIQKNKTARKSPISSLFFPNSIFWLLMLCCFFFSSSFHAGVVAPRQGIKSSENEDVNSILISPMFRLAKDTENEIEGVQEIQIRLTYSI